MSSDEDVVVAPRPRKLRRVASSGSSDDDLGTGWGASAPEDVPKGVRECVQKAPPQKRSDGFDEGSNDGFNDEFDEELDEERDEELGRELEAEKQAAKKAPLHRAPGNQGTLFAYGNPCKGASVPLFCRQQPTAATPVSRWRVGGAERKRARPEQGPRRSRKKPGRRQVARLMDDEAAVSGGDSGDESDGADSEGEDLGGFVVADHHSSEGSAVSGTNSGRGTPELGFCEGSRDTQVLDEATEASLDGAAMAAAASAILFQDDEPGHNLTSAGGRKPGTPLSPRITPPPGSTNPTNMAAAAVVAPTDLGVPSGGLLDLAPVWGDEEEDQLDMEGVVDVPCQVPRPPPAHLALGHATVVVDESADPNQVLVTVHHTAHLALLCKLRLKGADPCLLLDPKSSIVAVQSTKGGEGIDTNTFYYAHVEAEFVLGTKAHAALLANQARMAAAGADYKLQDKANEEFRNYFLAVLGPADLDLMANTMGSCEYVTLSMRPTQLLVSGYGDDDEPLRAQMQRKDMDMVWHPDCTPNFALQIRISRGALAPFRSVPNVSRFRLEMFMDTGPTGASAEGVYLRISILYPNSGGTVLSKSYYTPLESHDTEEGVYCTVPEDDDADAPVRGARKPLRECGRPLLDYEYDSVSLMTFKSTDIRILACLRGAEGTKESPLDFDGLICVETSGSNVLVAKVFAMAFEPVDQAQATAGDGIPDVRQ